MVVYLITNTVNGKPYVGQTQLTMKQRWRGHLGSARGTRSKFPIHEAIRKYGPAAFAVQSLVHVRTLKQLNVMERIWVSLMNSKVPNGYNLTDGGDGVLGLAEESRKRIGEANRGTRYALGAIRSEETRKRIGKASTGRFFSSASRAKMSAKRKGVPKSEEHRRKIGKGNLGKEISKSTREKLSRSIKAHWAIPENRKKMEIHLTELHAATSERMNSLWKSPKSRKVQLARLKNVHAGIKQGSDGRFVKRS